jgi:putative hydrolase of the HAD superfamily
MTPAVCIVFDLDDTLYLERDYVRSGFEAVGEWASKNASIEGLAGAAWRRFESGDRGNIFDQALGDIGCLQDRALISELVAVYRTHRPNIAVARDVASTLPQLLPHTHLALITDGFSICQRNKIDVLGLERWLKPIVVTDELGSGFRKPHPKAFEYIEQHFAQVATSFAYVGDNPQKDFTAPRLRNWTTFRIRREGGLHREVECRGGIADFEITRLDDLYRWLSPSTLPL